MNNLFTKQRGLALLLTIMAVVLGWYSLTLLSNTNGEFYPTGTQCYGVIVAIIVASLSWVWRCFTILPRESVQLETSN